MSTSTTSEQPDPAKAVVYGASWGDPRVYPTTGHRAGGSLSVRIERRSGVSYIDFLDGHEAPAGLACRAGEVYVIDEMVDGDVWATEIALPPLDY